MNRRAHAGLLLLGLVLLAPSGRAADAPSRTGLAIGRVEVSTVPAPAGATVRSATYTPSGRILFSYADTPGAASRDLKLATMDDTGANVRPVFAGTLPPRPKDNGIRFMVFADNKRVFLGDFILECAPSLDACEKSSLLPVAYPAEVADGPHVAHRWSEMIVAPDNRHVAWTTLLANYSAMVFIGELRRAADGYTIAEPRIISTLNPFARDPAHADGVLPQPVRGGEVKQFVAGGAAISLAGADRRDTPDSVVQDIATGRQTAITDDAAYTETTILSPDERLGVTMTTRFSPRTNLAILGLLPRPYPASLNMGLSMFAYTHAVTGVRDGRDGTVGPALIDIAASRKGGGYAGVDLARDKGWIFRSPMSWHPGSRKALWIEGRQGTETRRIRRLTLPEYRAAAAVTPRATPTRIPYAITDMAQVKAYAGTNGTVAAKVYGRRSGYIDYRRTPQAITKTYVNFSDDGRAIYDGQEEARPNPGGRSTYTADVTLAGPTPGRMDVRLTFGPLGGRPGELPAALIFDRDASGAPLTRGFAEYGGRRLEASDLLP